MILSQLNYLFCLLSSSIVFFVLLRSFFLRYKKQVLETSDTNVIPYINPSLPHPNISLPVYKPAKKCLRVFISHWLIFGVLWYLPYFLYNLQNSKSMWKVTFKLNSNPYVSFEISSFLN